MAETLYSIRRYVGTGSPQTLAVPEYISKAHIQVFVNGLAAPFAWAGPGHITLTATAGSTITIQRRSSPEARLVDYKDAVPLTEGDLDLDSLQAFFLGQEARDVYLDLVNLSDAPLADAVTAAAAANASAMAAAAYVATLTGSGAAGSVGFTQGGTGAISRTVQAALRERVSVRAFGALGDASHDDTPNIQAAIDYVRTLRNGELYFPPADPGCYYKITAPLNITGPIRMRGAGPNSVTIMGVGMAAGAYMLNLNCLLADGVEHLSMQGFTLRSLDGAPRGMLMKNASYMVMDDVKFHGLNAGIHFEGSRTYSNFFNSVTFYSITADSVRYQAGFTGGGQYVWNGCTFSGANGFVVDSTSFTDGQAFFGCNFEQCTTSAMYINGTVRGLALVGCRTEGSDTADFIFDPVTGKEVTGLLISGCYFSADTVACIPIKIGGSGGRVRGFSITGNSTYYAALNHFVFLNGEGNSGVISGNRFEQAGTLPVNVQRAGVVVFANENGTGTCADWWGTANGGWEQGTWTPVDGSGAALTFTAASGRWTRSGRMIFWQAFVSYPTTANGSNAEIGGLPFPVGGLSGDQEGRSGGRVDVTNAGAMGILQGVTSNTELAVVHPTTGAAVTNATLSGKYLYLSGCYSL